MRRNLRWVASGGEKGISFDLSLRKSRMPIRKVLSYSLSARAHYFIIASCPFYNHGDVANLIVKTYIRTYHMQ
jgi:hypothetical protein